MVDDNAIPTLLQTIDSISRNLLDKPEIKGMVINLILLTGSIALLARIFSSYKNKKDIDWVGWIIDITSVICASILVALFFKAIIFLMSYIANMIYPFEQWDNFLLHDLKSGFLKEFDSSNNPSQSFWLDLFTTEFSTLFNSIILSGFLTGLVNIIFYIVSLLAQFGFWLLLLWRSMYLLVLLVLAYVHIAKSLLPSYGLQSLLDYIKEIIQVSSWTVYFSAGLLVLGEMSKVIDNVYIADNVITLLNIQLLNIVEAIFHILFIVYVLSIPKFAAKHFGGFDTSALVYGASFIGGFLASKALKTVHSFKKNKGPLPNSK